MLLTGKTQTDIDKDIAVQKIARLKAYLASTDWKIARSVETGTAVEAATLTRRASARAEIMALRGKFDL